MGRAGGGRPTRGVAGRWWASQVAVERRRWTVAAEQAVQLVAGQVLAAAQVATAAQDSRPGGWV